MNSDPCAATVHGNLQDDKAERLKDGIKLISGINGTLTNRERDEER